MRNHVDEIRTARPLKVLLLGTIGLAVAGCSTEMTRFGSVFGEPQHTGSISPTPIAPVGTGMGGGEPGTVAAAPSGTVQSQPLASPGAQGQQAQHWGAAPSSQSSDGRSVVAGQGDTIYTIADRYNIPPNALMQANNLSSAGALQPGQRLVIPTYSARTGQWEAPQRTAAAPQAEQVYSPPSQPQQSAPAQQAPSGGGSHTVQPGDTVYSIARAHNARPNDIITANSLSSPDSLRVGQSLTIPGASGSTQAQAPAQQPQQTQPQQVAQQVAQQPRSLEDQAVELDTTRQMDQKPQAVEQTSVETASLPAGGGTPEADTRAAVPDPGALSSSGQFRWPVRGRVIAGFGEGNGGGRNDGINISVPEGTSVRAAENGVVAYAGNELEGYGNLVLIRHSDDWVSAYAHNKDITVSRGDTVTRGQVIATAGQTGSVTSPQVHFELRKGSQPVDPLSHLAEN